jgi:hypothetical protein
VSNSYERHILFLNLELLGIKKFYKFWLVPQCEENERKNEREKESLAIITKLSFYS